MEKKRTRGGCGTCGVPKVSANCRQCLPPPSTPKFSCDEPYSRMNGSGGCPCGQCGGSACSDNSRNQNSRNNNNGCCGKPQSQGMPCKCRCQSCEETSVEGGCGGQSCGKMYSCAGPGGGKCCFPRNTKRRSGPECCGGSGPNCGGCC